MKNQEQQSQEQAPKRGRGRPRKEEKQYGSFCVYISSEMIQLYGSLDAAKRVIYPLVHAVIQTLMQKKTADAANGHIAPK